MKTKSKAFSSLVVIFAAILIIFFGIVYYFSFQQRINSSKPPIVQNATPQIEVLAPDQNGLTTLIVSPLSQTSYKKFSISYPNNWRLTEGGENNTRFTLADGQNTITLEQPAVGGSVCIFADTDMSKLDEVWKSNPVQHNYKEITFKQGRFRRFEPSWLQSEDDTKHFLVCEIQKYSPLFEIPLDGGALSITASPNISLSELQKIDSILATYAYIDK